MPALGHSRRFDRVQLTSGLIPQADIIADRPHVPKVPKSDILRVRGHVSNASQGDYMLSFLFLRYLSDNYETAAKKELGKDYPDFAVDILLRTGASTPLQAW
jgi:hypothetical protein